MSQIGGLRPTKQNHPARSLFDNLIVLLLHPVLYFTALNESAIWQIFGILWRDFFPELKLNP